MRVVLVMPASGGLLFSLIDKFGLGYEHYAHRYEQRAKERGDGTSNSQVL
jgi:hypothetical protein